MYVLEGATLGGAFIHRHLAALPALASLRLRAFSPYGERTGVMWHAYRRATRAHVADRGDPARVVAAARDTFAALARWVEAAQRTTAWPVSGTAAIDLRVALGDVAGAVPLVAGSGPAGPRIARAAEEVTPPER
jgi:hypothetical protein